MPMFDAQRMAELKIKAQEDFKFTGLPTQKNEDWKYTNLYLFKEKKYGEGHSLSSGEILKNKLFLEFVSKLGFLESRLVFCDGRYVKELSHVAPGEAIEVLNLEGALQKYPNKVKEFFKDYFIEKPFSQMNTSQVKEGVFIRIRPQEKVKGVLGIIFITTQKNIGSHYRNLLCIEEGASLEVLEVHKGFDGDYFNNTVTQIVTASHSSCLYHRVQEEGLQAQHFHDLQVTQKKNSDFQSHLFSFGGELVRNETDVILKETHSGVVLKGLFVGKKSQHIDNKTFIDHESPHCKSEELYKGILDQTSNGIFNGKILVRKNSQKTDSRQMSKNLLLSESAQVNTLPQLFIHADDVKCSHGATVGQLDGNALFYLQSRGLSKQESTRLLTYAFAAEMVDSVKNENIRKYIDLTIQNWFSQ